MSMLPFLLLVAAQSTIYTEGVFMKPFDAIDCGNNCQATVTGTVVEVVSGFAVGDTFNCPGCQLDTMTFADQDGWLVIEGTSNTVSHFVDILLQLEFKPSTNGSRSLRYNFGNVFFNPSNSHFYSSRPCPVGVSAQVCDFWYSQGDCAATANDHFGLVGYLATITSTDEREFFAKRNLTGQAGGSDMADEDNWLWITGPEGCPPYDTQLTDGSRSACNVGPLLDAMDGCDSMLPPCGLGTPFGFTYWAGGEPNDVNITCPQYNGSCNTTGEDYLYVFPSSTGVWVDTPLRTDLNSVHICEWGGVGKLNTDINEIVKYQNMYSSCDQILQEVDCKNSSSCEWQSGCVALQPTSAPTSSPTLIPTGIPTALPVNMSTDVPTSVPTGAGVPVTPSNGFLDFTSSTTVGGATIGTTAVAALTGSSGGGTVTSKIVISSEMHCIREYPDAELPFAIHPTQFAINNNYWLGCVIGNIALSVFFWIVILIICRVIGWKTGDLQSIEAKFRYPGIVVPPILILQPSVLLYSGELLFRESDDTLSLVVGLSGMFFSFVFLVIIFRRFRTDNKHTYYAPIPKNEISLYSPAMIYIFGAGTWHNIHPNEYVARKGPLFDVYFPVEFVHGHYTLIEFMSVLVIIGLSWIPDEEASWCTVKISLMILVLTIQTITFVAKPIFLSKLLKHLSVWNGVASVVGLAFQLWSFHGYPPDEENIPGDISGHSMSVSVTLTLIRSLFDIFSVCMDLSSGFKKNLREAESEKQDEVVAASQNPSIVSHANESVNQPLSAPLPMLSSGNGASSTTLVSSPLKPLLLNNPNNGSSLSSPQALSQSNYQSSLPPFTPSSKIPISSLSTLQPSLLQSIDDANISRWGEHSVEYMLYNDCSL